MKILFFQAEVEKRGLKDIMSFIADLGGLPILQETNTWNTSDFSQETLLVKARKHTAAPPIMISSVREDPRNTPHNALFVGTYVYQIWSKAYMLC